MTVCFNVKFDLIEIWKFVPHLFRSTICDKKKLEINSFSSPLTRLNTPIRLIENKKNQLIDSIMTQLIDSIWLNTTANFFNFEIKFRTFFVICMTILIKYWERNKRWTHLFLLNAEMWRKRCRTDRQSNIENVVKYLTVCLLVSRLAFNSVQLN